MKAVNILCWAVLASTALLAQDGTFWGKNDGGTISWSSANYWYYQRVASDGGVAWFNNSQLDCLNVDVEGITLSGLQFSGRWMHVTGYPLTFTAENSWITRTAYLDKLGRDSYGHQPGFDVTFKGTGSNTISINDNGEFHMRVAAQDLGNFRVLGNHVMAWNTSGDCFTEGNFQLSEGRASIAPQLAAGETAEVTIGANEGTKFAYGPSLGYLRLNKGSGDGVTLKIGTLERFTGGGALAIEATTGLDNLGGTEKVLVTNGAPTVVNGICDASIVGHDYQSSPESFCFLTYDETDGFKKATVETKAFADAGANDIAAIEANTEISGEKAVHALYVNAQGDGPTITFADDSKLTVGDGVHPAGIIINAKDGNHIQPAFSGAKGTIAFGDAQGTIYFNNPSNKPTLTINQTITGTGGMVFTGSGTGTKSTLTLPRAAGWTGNTVISRICFYVTNANQLPEDGDVYVLGGKNGQKAASLRIANNVTFGKNQRIHFGGWGASDECAVVHSGGSNTRITYNGPVEFSGPTGFIDDGDYTHIFNGTVSGYGWCRLHKASYVFNGPITYLGDFRLVANETRLTFAGAGRPGAIRRIEYSTPKATLIFRDLDSSYDFTTPVTGGGNLQIIGSDIKLNGNQTFGCVTVGEGARVGIGPNVTYTDLKLEGACEIYSLDGAAVRAAYAMGAGETRALNGRLTAADGLSVHKDGAGTLIVGRDVPTVEELEITDGTVRLDNRIGATGTSTYWLDASQRDFFQTNATGAVTNWISANGNGVMFAHNGAAASMVTNRDESLPVVTFVNNQTNYCRFVCDRSLKQRTVYLVLAPARPSWWTKGDCSLSAWGWLGKGGIEHALRYQSYSGGWGLLRFETSFRMNGKSSTEFTPNDTMQIVGLFNAREDVANQYYSTFKPAVGGYESWSAKNNFNGGIAEVIAFDRVLNESEVYELENELSEKWGMSRTLWHDGVVNTSQVLDPNAAVMLHQGAILDLNGVNQTVASLAGEGMITNSSSRAATLTVTGEITFKGVVAPNVKILNASGDEAEIGDAGLAPPSSGLVYWLDAANVNDDTVEWKDQGTIIQSIKSSGGTVERFETAYRSPMYVAKAIGGNKPAIRFVGTSGDAPALKTDQPVTTRTVAMVMQLPDLTYSNNYFWGRHTQDKGFRLGHITSFDSDYGLRNRGYAYSAVGDTVWIDGEKKTVAYQVGDFSVNAKTPTRFIATRADWHTDTAYGNVVEAIGSYENRAVNMYIGEVIAYDHVLSDREAADLDRYFRSKWLGETSYSSYWVRYPIPYPPDPCGCDYFLESLSSQAFILHAKRTDESITKTGCLAIGDINRSMWTHNKLVLSVRSLNGKKVNVGFTLSHDTDSGVVMSSAPSADISGRAWREFVFGLDTDFNLGDASVTIRQVKIGAWVSDWKQGEEGGIEVKNLRLCGPNEVTVSSVWKTGDRFVSVPSKKADAPSSVERTIDGVPKRAPTVADPIKVYFAFDNEDVIDSIDRHRSQAPDAQQYMGFRETLLEYLDGAAVVTTNLDEAGVIVYSRCRPDAAQAAAIVSAVQDRGVPLYAASEVYDSEIEAILPCTISRVAPTDLPVRERIVGEGFTSEAKFGIYRACQCKQGGTALYTFEGGSSAVVEGTAGKGKVIYSMLAIGQSLIPGKESPDAFFVRMLGRLTGRTLPESDRPGWKDGVPLAAPEWQEGISTNGFGRFGWEVGSGLLVGTLGYRLAVANRTASYEFSQPRESDDARTVEFAGDRANPLAFGGEIFTDGENTGRFDASLGYPGIRWNFYGDDVKMNLANLQCYAYVPTGAVGRVVQVAEGEEIDVAEMSKPWILLYNGSEKDTPLALVFRKRPAEIAVMRSGDAVNGYEIFAEKGGAVGVVTPTWVHGTKTIDTSKWTREIPAETIAAADAWTARSLAYPASFRETFRLDTANGRVIVRDQYACEEGADDWGTVREPYAPVSPVAWTLHDTIPAAGGGTVTRFDESIVSADLPTLFGDFAICPGETEITWSLPLFTPDLGFLPHAKGYDALDAFSDSAFAGGVRWTCGGYEAVDYVEDKAYPFKESANLTISMHSHLHGMARCMQNPMSYSESNRALMRKRLTWRLMEPLETLPYKMVCRWRREPVSGIKYTIYMNSPRDISTVYEPETYGSKIIYGDSNETVRMILACTQKVADQHGQYDVVKANWDTIARHVATYPFVIDDWLNMCSGCLEWGGPGTIDMLNAEYGSMMSLARLAEIAGDERIRAQALYRAARRICPTLARLKMHAYFTKRGLVTDSDLRGHSHGFNEEGASLPLLTRTPHEMDFYDMSQGIPQDLVSLYRWHGFSELREKYVPLVMNLTGGATNLDHYKVAVLALAGGLSPETLEAKLLDVANNPKQTANILGRDWPGMDQGSYIEYALHEITGSPAITDCRDVCLHALDYDPQKHRLTIDLTPGEHAVFVVDGKPLENLTPGVRTHRHMIAPNHSSRFLIW